MAVLLPEVESVCDLPDADGEVVLAVGVEAAGEFAEPVRGGEQTPGGRARERRHGYGQRWGFR